MKYTITLLTLAAACLAGCSSTKIHTSPKPWNAITDGMTREEIVRTIGVPTSQAPSSAIWQSESWELRVTYDQNGRAKSVTRTKILKQ